MLNLDNIEKKQNIQLPEAYKKLYQSVFEKNNREIEIHVNDDVFLIRKFLSATEINDILDEFYDFWGYDIVPIAETEYEDYICLFYRENTKNPSIIYWNYDLSLENSSEGISFLYDSVNEFLVDIMKS